jgi:hypothetical protein
MIVAHAEKTNWGQVSGHRSGAIDFKRLLQGECNAPDNFELSLVRTAGNYYTPRHRHNFDQVRFCLEGTMNYAPGKNLRVGSVGYFPEGTFYGPQQDASGSIVLLLQMGGSAGYGFMSYLQLNSGYERLSDLGQFDGGVFTRSAPDGRSVRKDGYEAIWEYVNKREVEYPAPRFEEPVIMYPENFKWTEAGNGFERKHLGSFGERGLSVGLIRGSRGAKHRLQGVAAPELIFVTRGAFATDSSDDKLDAHSAARVDTRDQGTTFEVVEDAEFFYIRMPAF